MASILIPNLGIAQEWITSEEVARSCTSTIMGRTARLSTSRRRNSPSRVLRLVVFFMMESNALIVEFWSKYS